jgi:histone-lysine N-methyltransferase SETMAR
LASLGFPFLDHPAYSPDLALSDYHLFPGLKKTLIGRHFSSDTEVTASAETWLEDNLLISFLVACKSQSNGLEVY